MEKAMNSRYPYRVSVASYFTLLMILLLPSPGAARVVSLAPGYSANAFTTLNFSSRAIAFDSALNLYAMDLADDSSGSVRIYVLHPSDGYSARSLYTSYNTGTCCTSSLFFSSNETKLTVSEVFSSGDSGLIRELDTTTFAITANWPLPGFRAGGIAVDETGTLIFPGRLFSDPNFGNLYRMGASGIPEVVVNGLVATGVTIDTLGNIYASTPGTDVTSSFDANSIYRFDPVTFDPTLIATFDSIIAELAADTSGNIYALEDPTSATPTIYRISAIPLPASVWLLGSGLLGLIGIARRKQVV